VKTMVFGIPAEYGGALTILKQYYDKAVQEKDIDWYFVLSTPTFEEKDNIRILRFPWIKKSWFHRLYFDIFVAYKIVKKYKIDEIISLQNIIVKGVRVKQTLYLQQPLPFAKKRYGIIEDFRLWVYQNIISKMIFDSIRKADTVIVQTNWMKNACIERTNATSDKIVVIQPKISVRVKRPYKQEDDNIILFFYPANAARYKNHRVVVEAAKLMSRLRIENYGISFTLKGSESKDIKKLYDEVKINNLPIYFIGQLSLEEVYKYYSKSILIFPSFIETFGLPMLEAKMHGCPILASDCTFSHEILDGYEKVKFFDPFDVNGLATYMLHIIKDNSY